ncbi:MAG: SurA N-terminal domain-containing protein [Gammaproteobacteria bacterium]
MLQAIRDRVTGWIAWVIVGLIAVVFALWGIDSYLKNEAKVFAAVVNGVEIPVAEYRFAKQQQVQRMRGMLGDQFDANLPGSTEFKSAVLNRLVEEELLVQAATAAGMAISDGFLAARIHSIPDFQEDGEFSPELYQRLLAQQGMNPQTFEPRYRRALLVNQFLTGISGTAVVAPQAVEQGLRLQGQERSLSYLRLPLARYLEAAAVTPEQVAAFYEENKSRFVEPEQIRVQYLELSLDTLAAGLQASEAEIEEYYAAEKARLTIDEQRRARHILIQLADDASEEDVAAARAKAEDLVKRLREGADFAALAKEFSDDPGSAAEGGDLGLFGKGMMVPEFEAATFALDKDAISDPVRSPFGFHIIQVTEIQAAREPDLEAVRTELAEQVVRKHAEQMFVERSETLAALSFEHPDTLTVAAEELGLDVQESGWMPVSGANEGIGSHPQVIEAVLEDDVRVDGNNSRPVEIGPDHIVVARVLEEKPAQQLSLETVRGAIEMNLRQQSAREAARAAGEALLQRLQAGEALPALAAEMQLEPQQAGFIGRNNGEHDRQIVAEAFRVPRADAGQVSSAGVTLANGDYALLQIDAVRDGDTAKLDAADRDGFRRNLEQLYGTLESTALLEQLKAQATIEQDVERLD